MHGPESFGSRLKAERERRGIALKTIAASTKIKESLFRELERDDVSKWPQGIFRRAFVREYAASIGLAPEPVVAEFVRLFPEDQATAPVPKIVFAEPSQELRLTLANRGRASLRALGVRTASAMVEACALLGLVQVLTWAAGLHFWTVCAATSMLYYGVSSALWDRTPLSRWLQRDRRAVAPPAEEAKERDSRGVLDLLVHGAGLESYTPGAAAGTADVATGS